VVIERVAHSISLFGPISAKRTQRPDDDVSAYCGIRTNDALRQGEILHDLTYYGVGFDAENQQTPFLASGDISYAVIMTPDCDLWQDFRSTSNDKDSKLFSILLFGAEESSQVKQRLNYNKAVWDRVENNQLEQFQFLDEIAPGDGIVPGGTPKLVIDFKRYFTLPTKEIYRQLRFPNDVRPCQRLCRLTDLWRENLQRRAMSYMQRVGLPDPSDRR
jgi:hypothetical protein